MIVTQQELASSRDGVILDRDHRNVDEDAIIVTRIEKDLPDPLEAPGGSPAADPDELVAQLAGDAIDRLLEETEKGLVPPRPRPQDDPLNELESPVQPGADSDQSQKSPDAADGPMVASDAIPGGSDTAVSESSEDIQDSQHQEGSDSSDALNEVQAGLDSLFGALGKETSANTNSAAFSDKVGSEKVEHPPEASVPMPPPVDVPPEIANDDGHDQTIASPEQGTADPSTSVDSVDPTTDARKLLLEETRASARSPVLLALLLPLKLMNAPFSGLSDQTRDVLGQIGLITLVNALAILVYVLIFR